jgi:imidazole glycerol-phosphate synthase subunit HisH
MAEAIALIDVGAGNLHSVHNAVKAAGGEAIVTADASVVRKADRIILPGVGAFGACLRGLLALPGMVDALEGRVFDKKVPFLGICVGMQIMADGGEEFGWHRGLGWIPGVVRPLKPADPAAKVPHMGWNDVAPVSDHALVEPGEAYFLHSFAFTGEDVIATTDHAGPITAAIGKDNLIGVQFHPEKSQRYGIEFLSRFLAWQP